MTPDLLFCQQIQNLLAHFLQFAVCGFAWGREINRHISFDIAVFHDQDAVAQQQGFFHVVGDEQDRFFQDKAQKLPSVPVPAAVAGNVLPVKVMKRLYSLNWDFAFVFFRFYFQNRLKD